ncbi:hypothetical protein [Pseudomonas sp. BRM28]|uniref:hypothetical protein n=1 Tax=Pseudomonas sp. BRM28 TaxID=2045201 RepID=UPI000CEE0734|nr:hypothetical protein [Pseudomonas sp. BRM28]PPS62629.1 hypothetical protein CR917_17310 [Pseudomonas sp. BRM28]
MSTKSRAMLAALALFAASTSGCVTADEVFAECDGRQMYNYVDVALRAGGGVVNVANDPAYGGGSVSIALKSQNMRTYNAMIADIREHDLSLSRSGCKSLTNGPTKGMMSTLRQVDAKIKALVNSQYSEKGILTEGFGETR